MYVNTSVVKALMQLRGVTDVALSSLAHVTVSDLRAWLNDEGENSAEQVEFDMQLEILKLLGVPGEQPRADIVHYWRIHEELFSRDAANYWALQVLLRTFGPAQASYLAPECDPMLNFQARAHFGLKFSHFLAIVEVTANPLRNISFGPEVLSGISWTPECMGVLLPEAEFKRLQPGAMRVRSMKQYLTYTSEVKQWEQLREAALGQGVHADQVAKLLMGEGYLALTAPPTGPAEMFENVPQAPRAAAAPVPEAALEGTTPAAAANEAPAATVAELLGSTEHQEEDAPDAMRLFMTPVRPLSKPGEQQTRLKRVQ